jgi:ADP-ribose pyrophosphatase YjhB (NUDIX family)
METTKGSTREKTCDIHTLLVDVVVMFDSGVLLIRPTQPPAGRPGWWLPGGPLRHGEHPEEAARRYLREQVGLEPEWLDLAEVESIPGDNWRLIFHYSCDAPADPQPGPEVAEARFFQIEHLPELAHGEWEREVIFRVMVGL